MESFEKQSALVTGGARGVGRAVAEALADAGALVTIVDVDRDQGTEVARAIGGKFIKGDVSVEQDNFRAVSAAVAEHGGLDLLVLNAGVAPWCDVGPDFDLDRYRQTMGVNVDGVIFGMNAAIPELKNSRNGSIVVIASIASLIGAESNPIYSASKHAVVGLVRSVAPNLIEEGIKVNAICPGFIDTDLVGQVRDTVQKSSIPLMKPKQIADSVVEVFKQGQTGQAWPVQPGRPLDIYRFRGVPGARYQDGGRIEEGAAPAIRWKDSTLQERTRR